MNKRILSLTALLTLCLTSHASFSETIQKTLTSLYKRDYVFNLSFFTPEPQKEVEAPLISTGIQSIKGFMGNIAAVTPNFVKNNPYMIAGAAAVTAATLYVMYCGYRYYSAKAILRQDLKDLYKKDLTQAGSIKKRFMDLVQEAHAQSIPLDSKFFDRQLKVLAERAITDIFLGTIDSFQFELSCHAFMDAAREVIQELEAQNLE